MPTARTVRDRAPALLLALAATGLLTPREIGGGSGADVGVVRTAGRRYPRHVRVLDWVRVSARRGGWFAGDGIHLGPGGAAGLARMLREALPLTMSPAVRAKSPHPGPSVQRRDRELDSMARKRSGSQSTGLHSRL